MLTSRSTHINWIHLYNGSIIFHSMHESYINDFPINKFTNCFGLSPTKDIILNRLEHIHLLYIHFYSTNIENWKDCCSNTLKTTSFSNREAAPPQNRRNRDVFSALSCSIYTFCLSHTKAPVGNTETNRTNFLPKLELPLIVTIFHREQRLESDSSAMACTEEKFPFLHPDTPSHTFYLPALICEP